MTEARDAASRLTIEYRNSMAEAVGPEHGLSDDMLDSVAPEIAAQHERLTAEHAAGEQRWMDLPSDTVLAATIEAFAAEARGETPRPPLEATNIVLPAEGELDA